MYCAMCGTLLAVGATACGNCAQRRRPGSGRIVLSVLLLLVAVYNGMAMGRVLIPETGLDNAFRLRAHANPAAGMHLVAVVLATLLAGGGLGGGWLDRHLARKGVVATIAAIGLAAVAALAAWQQEQAWPGLALLGVAAVAFVAVRPSCRTLPIVVVVVALAAFGARFVLATTWHSDPIDAARAFDVDVNGLDLTSTGTVLFGPGDDGRTHMAWITPDLVRALTQRFVSVNVWFAKDRDCSLPGFGPVAALLALAALGGLWPMGRRRALPPWLLAVHLYVALWWSVSQTGFITRELGLHPAVFLFAAFLVVLAIAHAVCIRRGLARTWGTPAAEAWVTVAHAPMLALVAGIYLVTFKSPGSPAFLWMTLYVAAGALAWRASLPVREEVA